MTFGRRKSVIQLETAEDDAEAKRRNRLSKPLTSRSSTNLNVLLDQESGQRSKNGSVEVVDSQVSPKLEPDEKRQFIRSHVLIWTRTMLPQKLCQVNPAGVV